MAKISRPVSEAPWFATLGTAYWAIRAEGKYIAYVLFGEKVVGNVCLIKAAPELLQALKAFTAARSSTLTPTNWGQIYDAAEAAIRKAEGDD